MVEDNYPPNLFKLATNKPTAEEDELYFDKHKESICEVCIDEHGGNGSFPNLLCNGRWCEEMIDMHRDNNPNEVEEAMKEHGLNPDVVAVFSKKVNGDELIAINEHYNEAMLRRILMEKFSKEIQTECKDAEEERLEAEKK